ncbi:hypothetical protein GYMLUDRAFT_705432 [Collybiopsis luxurians FD-317 M1]|uniref:Uncharacterized protein n=1 Tax=Collybiopsis luxurians FD-317 M1 TaxID=944289 RepID=A0A0D0B487_9AGAR|nr:hypothetical protein GYMLUDRAFT_705432 [Collybiopsis luxurians FD-317 M1]
MVDWHRLVILYVTLILYRFGFFQVCSDSSFDTPHKIVLRRQVSVISGIKEISYPHRSTSEIIYQPRGSQGCNQDTKELEKVKVTETAPLYPLLKPHRVDENRLEFGLNVDRREKNHENWRRNSGNTYLIIERLTS